jgi:hypothetical protein
LWRLSLASMVCAELRPATMRLGVTWCLFVLVGPMEMHRRDCWCVRVGWRNGLAQRPGRRSRQLR